jgi:DNA repair exonuclease SbcCD ATPase subunit
LDWNEVVKTGLTVVGSGGSAFAGAFLRFKQRLKKAEDEAAEALLIARAARDTLFTLKASFDAAVGGWKLEFADLREDFRRDLEHREEVEQAREDGRASRRDPTEDLREELHALRDQLEKLKERQARYVRNETFAEHARAQETQWKEIARVMGRLEALARER